MAGRSKNATSKFFPRVVLELPDKYKDKDKDKFADYIT